MLLGVQKIELSLQVFLIYFSLFPVTVICIKKCNIVSSRRVCLKCCTVICDSRPVTLPLSLAFQKPLSSEVVSRQV